MSEHPSRALTLHAAAPDGRALCPDDAAAFCACSRRHFETHIAPHVPFIDLRDPTKHKAMPRYLVDDLRAYLLSRRRLPSAA